jgi:uncharacterized OB-fold protein
MSEYKKPLPEIEGQWSEEFWEGCKKRQLLIQKCDDCGQINIYSPRMLCPHCLSTNLNWIQSSGRGKIYTFTIVKAYPPKMFTDALPYAIGVITLEEGPRIRSNIVQCNLDELKCDMDVEVVFEDITDRFALPKFRPVRKLE